MSGQLESPHFFRTGDVVQGVDGSIGSIVEGSTLYATVAWTTGAREEIDQFDPGVAVLERAEPKA